MKKERVESNGKIGYNLCPTDNEKWEEFNKEPYIFYFQEYRGTIYACFWKYDKINKMLIGNYNQSQPFEL